MTAAKPIYLYIHFRAWLRSPRSGDSSTPIQYVKFGGGHALRRLLAAEHGALLRGGAGPKGKAGWPCATAGMHESTRHSRGHQRNARPVDMRDRSARRSLRMEGRHDSKTTRLARCAASRMRRLTKRHGIAEHSSAPPKAMEYG